MIANPPGKAVSKTPALAPPYYQQPQEAQSPTHRQPCPSWQTEGLSLISHKYADARAAKASNFHSRVIPSPPPRPQNLFPNPYPVNKTGWDITQSWQFQTTRGTTVGRAYETAL